MLRVDVKQGKSNVCLKDSLLDYYK
jgi:hypothetical protein